MEFLLSHIMGVEIFCWVNFGFFCFPTLSHQPMDSVVRFHFSVFLFLNFKFYLFIFMFGLESVWLWRKWWSFFLFHVDGRILN